MSEAKANPNDPPVTSGEMKRLKITLSAEGYATSESEWLVPEELVRPYAIAYNSGIAALGLAISKEIYETIIDSGYSDAEIFLAQPMMAAASGEGKAK